MKIAIFASGSGSNAQKIIEHFKNTEIEVVLLLSNNPEAGVIGRARKAHIPTLIFDKENLQNGKVAGILQSLDIDLLVLAGFLWLVPSNLIQAFPNRILNIHPALLPKYGGKGMWGHHVHEAVVAAGETETGISIHLVNEHYDEGAIIFQKARSIEISDTPEQVASKVLELEHQYFPKVIEKYLRSLPTKNSSIH